MAAEIYHGAIIYRATGDGWREGATFVATQTRTPPPV